MSAPVTTNTSAPVEPTNPSSAPTSSVSAERPSSRPVDTISSTGSSAPAAPSTPSPSSTTPSEGGLLNTITNGLKSAFNSVYKFCATIIYYVTFKSLCIEASGNTAAPSTTTTPPTPTTPAPAQASAERTEAPTTEVATS